MRSKVVQFSLHDFRFRNIEFARRPDLPVKESGDRTI